MRLILFKHNQSYVVKICNPFLKSRCMTELFWNFLNNANAQVLLRFDGGARGMLWSSQVATGHENSLALRVYGSEGGLEWRQEDPNYLWFTPLGEPRRRITRGGAGAGESAARMTRIPPGHPEGYLEGFANIYGEAALAIAAHRSGAPCPEDVMFPGMEDGLLGMAFIDACVTSSKKGGVWQKLRDI